MSSAEDRLNAAMSAAADLAAREIPAAPPLRLPPEPAPRALHDHAPRRWIRWIVPLAAAAAVIALAISLALIKDIQNGSMVPPNPATTTGPGGIPRYYVALSQYAGHGDYARNGIVVGDSLTGKAVTTVSPPARTTFESVAGAANDRTFAVYGVTSSTGSFARSAKATMTGRWYEVVIAPGTDRPARLTPLPLKPFTGPYVYTSAGVQLDDAFGIVLSGSGREFAAVALANSHGLTVQVFSTATGRLLHVWTTSDQALVNLPTLSWIDGDEKLALLSHGIDAQRNSASSSTGVTVREWPVAGPASGDLMAVSQVVWQLPIAPSQVRFTPVESCVLPAMGGPVQLSADAKTFSCATGKVGPTGDTVKFFTYPLAASTTATATGRLDYQVTLPKARGVYYPEVLWTGHFGGPVIGGLIPFTGSSAATANGPRIGVMSHGRFTPLRFPAGLNLSAGIGSIAW